METQTTQDPKFASYAVLELMGHRRLGGYVREAQLAGAGVLRIDIPKPDAKCWEGDVPPAAEEIAATQFYMPGSLYGLTAVSGKAARAVAVLNRHEPVSKWDLAEAEQALARASRAQLEAAKVPEQGTSGDDRLDQFDELD